MNKPVQIHDVPDEAVAVLRARAGVEGMSLPAYLRRMVVNAAAQPTVAEILAEVAKRPAARLAINDIVEATHTGRGD
jgi:hypothetical protein